MVEPKHESAPDRRGPSLAVAFPKGWLSGVRDHDIRLAGLECSRNDGLGGIQRPGALLLFHMFPEPRGVFGPLGPSRNPRRAPGRPEKHLSWATAVRIRLVAKSPDDRRDPHPRTLRIGGCIVEAEAHMIDRS